MMYMSSLRHNLPINNHRKITKIFIEDRKFEKSSKIIDIFMNYLNRTTFLWTFDVFLKFSNLLYIVSLKFRFCILIFPIYSKCSRTFMFTFFSHNTNHTFIFDFQLFLIFTFISL
jgi:hypothetical protein